MKIPYELALGWRYTRAGRATRRNGFISFISGVSMLGIALGITGAPEVFLVDENGIIRFHQAGPLRMEQVEELVR